MATIVIDRARDVDRAIELVNEAQIFRLLRRPFNPIVCRPYVDAAMARYWRIKQQPAGGVARCCRPSRRRRAARAASTCRSNCSTASAACPAGCIDSDAGA